MSQPVEFSSVAQLKVFVTNSGSHFFDRGAMKFFNSKIESGILQGAYFITSERMELDMPKLYTIRYVEFDPAVIPAAQVEELGEFQEFTTLTAAKAALKTRTS